MESITLSQVILGLVRLIVGWCAFGTLNYVWSKRRRDKDLAGVSAEDRVSFFVDDSVRNAVFGPFGTLMLILEALVV